MCACFGEGIDAESFETPRAAMENPRLPRLHDQVACVECRCDLFLLCLFALAAPLCFFPLHLSSTGHSQTGEQEVPGDFPMPPLRAARVGVQIFASHVLEEAFSVLRRVIVSRRGRRKPQGPCTAFFPSTPASTGGAPSCGVEEMDRLHDGRCP